MNYLVVNNISKAYRNNKVLENISFALSEGKIAAITGENGSGKTTLLNLITGWIKPDSGETSILTSFGFCPQETLLFSRLTVRENIDYFSTAYARKDQPHDSQKMEELLKFFSLNDYKDKKAGILSGGTKQKLNLILSLLHDPDLMIMDEPYSSLDWDTYLKFWEYASARKKEGKSILIVSHFIYERSLIDELYIIRNKSLICA